MIGHVVVVLALLASCEASSWPQLGGGPQHAGHSPYSISASQGAEVSTVWSQQVTVGIGGSLIMDSAEVCSNARMHCRVALTMALCVLYDASTSTSGLVVRSSRSRMATACTVPTVPSDGLCASPAAAVLAAPR